MELARRTRWLALSAPVALALAAAVARPAPPGVLAGGPVRGLACVSAGGSPIAGQGAPAWYRLDPTLDATGTLAGRRLISGRGSGRWTADLPPESFASGPVGGRVLVGDDDGRRSRLRLFDTERGCWNELATEASVIRSALLSPDAQTVFEHRVDRVTRRDLGVWVRDLPASSRSTQLLPGLEPDAAYGPTFATTLLVAADGRLVASSCAERACRTRVVDLGARTVLSEGGTGPVAGLVDGRLVVLKACEGLPCEVDSVDLSSHSVTPLGTTEGPVALAGDGSGGLVLAGGRGLRVLQPGSPGIAELPGTAGLAPVPGGSTADSGIEAPPGLVAVAPGGLVADASSVRFLDPVSMQLTADEVLP